MARSQVDLIEWLEAIGAGGDLDVERCRVKLVLQALIDAEATEVIGAKRHERPPAGWSQRNGSREWLLSTKAGDVERRIPQLRQGSVCLAVLERRRRLDRALVRGGGRGPWLDLVERWFAELTRGLRQRSAPRSVTALETDRRHWAATGNEHPRPFDWPTTAEEIVSTFAQHGQRISGSGH